MEHTETASGDMAWARRAPTLPTTLRIGLHSLLGLFELDLRTDMTIDDWIGNRGRSIDTLLDTAAAIDALLEGDETARYHLVEFDLCETANDLSMAWLVNARHRLAAELFLRGVAGAAP